MYTWEDAEGIHFVDDLSKVPKRYQNKIEKRPGINSNATAATSKDSPTQQFRREQRDLDVQTRTKNRQMEEENETRQRAAAEASARQFKNKADLEMRRLQSEKDALRGSPFVDKSIDNQIEKLKNNPDQYFYDEEQRQKNKVPVINVWR
jgi:hypothetical protein